MERVPISTFPPATSGAIAGSLRAERRVLVDLGRRSGLAAVGVTDTGGVRGDPWCDLLERRRRGLHGGMQFTYRNPERSTDPARILVGAKALVVGALSYRHEEPPPIRDRGRHPPGRARRPAGRVARYARQDHYGALRSALAPIADHLEGLGVEDRHGL